MSQPSPLIGEIREKMREAAYLASAIGLLEWDEQVMMPAGGEAIRPSVTAYLAGLHHQKATDPALESLLEKAAGKPGLADAEEALVREAVRDFQHSRKLPTEFVSQLAAASSEGYARWKEARAKANFSLLQPCLENMVALKRQEADYLGYQDSPYDALLDVYEPGFTSAQADVLFSELREGLKGLLATIAASQTEPPPLPDGPFPVPEQAAWMPKLAARLGYDLERGRIDPTAHPFEINLHPADVRVTTRYNEEDLWGAIGSTVHEVGHALYEQGMDPEWFGTPLAEAVSHGIHESQSRVWENLVGKSLPFWNYFFPLLKERFPSQLAAFSPERFYRSINPVRPTLIRTESDEVTYNLHIILRYEIEKGLIEGTVQVKDLPEIWNGKTEEYLGITVPDAAAGVLQDVHWSSGNIGYFPTYALGNLYSAHFFAAAEKALPNLRKEFSHGEFSSFLTWLRTNIHCHGRRYSAEELLRRIDGSALSVRPFLAYLEKKYGELYPLPL